MKKVTAKKHLLMLLSIFVLLLAITYTLSPVYASDSTPSADLKQKLKALQDEIASKAAKLKVEVGNKLQNKAYIGFIKTISDSSLTIGTQKGSRIITVTDYTNYSGKTTKSGKINLKSLSEDDYIAALGDVDESEVLTAKKVVKLSSQDEEITAIFGNVTSVESQTITIQKSEGSSGQNQNISLVTNDDTNFKIGKNSSDITDIKQGNTIIAVGTPSKSNMLKVRFVYVVPYGLALKPKISTPSAKISPSITPKTLKK